MTNILTCPQCGKQFHVADRAEPDTPPGSEAQIVYCSWSCKRKAGNGRFFLGIGPIDWIKTAGVKSWLYQNISTEIGRGVRKMTKSFWIIYEHYDAVFTDPYTDAIGPFNTRAKAQKYITDAGISVGSYITDKEPDEDDIHSWRNPSSSGAN